CCPRNRFSLVLRAPRHLLLPACGPLGSPTELGLGANKPRRLKSRSRRSTLPRPINSVAILDDLSWLPFLVILAKPKYLPKLRRFWERETINHSLLLFVGRDAYVIVIDVGARLVAEDAGRVSIQGWAAFAIGNRIFNFDGPVLWLRFTSRPGFTANVTFFSRGVHR